MEKDFNKTFQFISTLISLFIKSIGATLLLGGLGLMFYSSYLINVGVGWPQTFYNSLACLISGIVTLTIERIYKFNKIKVREK